MTEAELPVAWLTYKGEVRGTLQPPIQLAVAGYAVTRAVVSIKHNCIVCMLVPDCDEGSSSMIALFEVAIGPPKAVRFEERCGVAS